MYEELEKEIIEAAGADSDTIEQLKLRIEVEKLKQLQQISEALWLIAPH